MQYLSNITEIRRSLKKLETKCRQDIKLLASYQQGMQVLSVTLANDSTKQSKRLTANAKNKQSAYKAAASRLLENTKVLSYILNLVSNEYPQDDNIVVRLHADLTHIKAASEEALANFETKHTVTKLPSNLSKTIKSVRQIMQPLKCDKMTYNTVLSVDEANNVNYSTIFHLANLKDKKGFVYSNYYVTLDYEPEHQTVRLTDTTNRQQASVIRTNKTDAIQQNQIVPILLKSFKLQKLL